MLRTPTTVVLCLSICSFALAQEEKPATAAAPPQVAAAAKHYAIVAKGRNINVRTAASVEGGYPFFQVQEGNVVEVLYEKYGWSRIQTSTPVFAKAFGYVNPKDIKVNGKEGTVLRRTTLRAPNMNQKGKASASWEGLDPALQPNTKIKLIDFVPGLTSADPGVWKVELPAQQMAWINSDFLRKATKEEIAAAKITTTDPTADQKVRALQTDAADGTPDTTGDTDGTTEVVVADATEQEAEATTDTPELTPDEVRAEKLAALDAAFRVMLKEDIQSAELELLQKQFMEFAQDADATDLQRGTAQSRIEVLTLKVNVQDRLARLKSMRDRTRIDGENISATGVAMDFRAPFDVVGRLNASVVFNGKGSMPLLFRLQDPASGHTMGYLVPDKRYDMAAMTGLMVGIVGSSQYDEALQLNVITPRRIDLVADPARVTPALTTTAPTSEPTEPTEGTVVEAETSGETDTDN